MPRACRFTAPFGSREIYHDGKPFLFIERSVNRSSNGPRPTDVDTVAKEIKRLLCGEQSLRSELAGSFLDKLLSFGKKKKPKRRVGDQRIYYVPSGRGGRTINERAATVIAGARRRKRRRR